MNTHYQNYDKQNMFGIIFNLAEQLEHAITIGKNILLKNNYHGIHNIVFAGMGGSGIAGDIVALLTGHTATLPMIVSRSYHVPMWVNEHTLVICLSYSGNTEETLSAYADAHKKGARIIGITSGGHLAAELRTDGYDIITIPGGLPPRASLGYLVVPLLFLMHHLGLAPQDIVHQLQKTISNLKLHRHTWSNDQDPENLALSIAQKIYQSYPLIYGEAEKTSTIALRWRGQLAENSKMLSSSHQLPELNHNEIVGFQHNHDILSRCGVIWLVDSEMDQQMAKRLEITKQIIQPMVAYQLTIEALGSTFIERMWYLIYLGDWVSFWCAILHHEDPTPVDRITNLKRLLTK